MKSTTEQVQASKDKGIITGIDRDFFRLYCEDNEQLKKSMEELIYIGNHSGDERIRVDVHKYIISQLIGNPKQATEIGAGKGVEITIKTGTIDDKD